MPLDKSHRPTSLCSYKSVTPAGGFTLQVSLSFGSISINSHALLDSGASTCFIDIAFVRGHKIPTICTTQPISVEAIDGRVLSSGAVTEATVPLVFQVGFHLEVLTLYLIATPRHLIFLGLSWLETHNPMVNWCTRCITFPQTQRRSFPQTRLLVWGLLSAWVQILLFSTQSPTLPILILAWSFPCPLCHKTSLFLSPICTTDCGHIAPMIAQSNSKRAHTHHLGPSMSYLNLNLRPFACI